MPASPYLPVQKARERLASRLVEIRKDVGINSRELARRLGWFESTVSRIVNAITPPSEEDIRAWCVACDAEQEIPGLVASLRMAEGAYVEWRRMERAGLRAAQESVLALYERTRRFKAYSSSVLPGMIQTRAYMTAVLRNIQSHRGLVDDVEAAVAVRMDRQRLLDTHGKTFAFVLEEQVLWTRVADEETMAGQLGHLLTIMTTRPNVSIGIIPRSERREPSPGESFWILGRGRPGLKLA
ncbi:MAG: helix-turn-helix transcriptional regulator [Pseudonocardiaceae bacterium]